MSQAEAATQEVTIHDVDIEADALMVDEAARVNWHALTEAEASCFGLSMGLYRDALHTQEKRRVAWGTATGGVISMSVLAIACEVGKTGPWFALGLIISVQAVRALWLYLKAYRARREVRFLERQAVDVIRELAEAHPAGSHAG